MADEPKLCPVCGARAYQDRIAVDLSGRFMETIPGLWHCPNENDAQHLAAEARAGG